jgi:hypothetical protein
VQPFAHIADTRCKLGFHEHVNIFRGGVNSQDTAVDIGQDAAQTADDSGRVLPGNDPLRGQHRGMGDGTPDILLIHFWNPRGWRN